ncbi:hypothetical protein [Pseudorhodoferax sp.]|uniref:hypothetical protein n=1 Tax=Pseudorhodoferax sp. TaxID=1993553 RepID=UPI0039E41DEF
MKRASPIELQQLALFEPEGKEAVKLMQKALAESAKCKADADRLRLIGVVSGAELLERLADAFRRDALVFAILLDLEREAGL